MMNRSYVILKTRVNITGTTATPEMIPAGFLDVLLQIIITFGKNGAFTLEYPNIDATQQTITADLVVLYHGLILLFRFQNMNVLRQLYVNINVLNRNGCGQQTASYEDPLEPP